MQRFTRLAIIVTVLLACVGCDQVTKSLAREHLQGREAIVMLRDTVRLQYTENPGGFLSLGAALPHGWRTAVFTISASVMLAAALWYAYAVAATGLLDLVALALIGAGGIGNIIDRIRYDGYVTDFLNVGIGWLRTGIFNVADVALMIGIALLVLRPRPGLAQAG